MNKIADFWEEFNDCVRCTLCPNYCVIPINFSGKCRKRYNISNVLYTQNYAETISLSLDPIEKKPLYHFYPGEKILSLGSNSCNLSCQFCQNYMSSQKECDTQTISPDDLLDICLKNNINHVAFTYTEPFTWYEYIYDSARLLKNNNISVVLVTNAYVNPEPLKKIIPYITSMNIDLKSFSESFYKTVCGGKLKPILKTIEYVAALVHLEITLLLIPSLNDNPDELEQLFLFIKNINQDIPLHISKYYPRYMMRINETDETELLNIVKESKKFLNFVYPGNIINQSFSNTYCPKCNSILIERQFHQIRILNLKDNQCSICGNIIKGIY